MNVNTTVTADTLDDVHYMSLTDLGEAIRTRAISPVEVTEAMLSRIEAVDGELKSYLTVLPDHARAAAQTAQAELDAGLWRGPLHGVPIAVKDLCETTYAPTSAGMKIHAEYIAEQDSTVVSRLDKAGAVMLGKLTMTEGAMSGHHPDMKTPLNPWKASAWTGASSSGSGAATAAGLCFGSLGSDTGGSIRLPSTACGLTGVKPTWGRGSRAGVFALADSLDHVGPMCRTASDAAAMLATIAGPDPRDPTTLTAPVPDYMGALGGSIAGLRIGLDEEYVFGGTDPQVAAMMRDTIEVLTDLGAVFVPISFPSMADISPNWIAICTAECAAAHKDTYPRRNNEYGPMLTWVIETGLALTPVQLAEALQYRLKICGAIARDTDGVDVLLVPGIGCTLMDADVWAVPPDQQPADTLGQIIRYTAVFDMTGQPTISLNGGFDAAGLPMGFQLVGKHLDEATLLKAGHAFQSVTGWHTQHPSL